MQSWVFLTYFFQKLSKENLWGDRLDPPLVQEGLKILSYVHPAEGTQFSSQRSTYNDKSKPYPESHSKFHGDKINFSINNDPLYQGSLLRQGLKQKSRRLPWVRGWLLMFSLLLASCLMSWTTAANNMTFFSFNQI